MGVNSNNSNIIITIILILMHKKLGRVTNLTKK